ncbi:phosphate acyltransferase, partial [Vibrio cholerae]|uniref:phosphate acyltransferase n=1 Tax=Vibrio cholerae TaxID=666 RepID=UPI0039C954BB
DLGLAQNPIVAGDPAERGKLIPDLDAYARELSARRDPMASTTQRLYERVRRSPKRVVFAEAEEEQVMRAAISFTAQGL